MKSRLRFGGRYDGLAPSPNDAIVEVGGCSKPAQVESARSGDCESSSLEFAKAEISQLHREAMASTRLTLERILHIGAILSEIKKRHLKHGQCERFSKTTKSKLVDTDENHQEASDTSNLANFSGEEVYSDTMEGIRRRRPPAMEEFFVGSLTPEQVDLILAFIRWLEVAPNPEAYSMVIRLVIADHLLGMR